MNEYCDFMEKYENSDDVASMLNDYTEYMKNMLISHRKWTTWGILI